MDEFASCCYISFFPLTFCMICSTLLASVYWQRNWHFAPVIMCKNTYSEVVFNIHLWPAFVVWGNVSLGLKIKSFLTRLLKTLLTTNTMPKMEPEPCLQAKHMFTSEPQNFSHLGKRDEEIYLSDLREWRRWVYSRRCSLKSTEPFAGNHNCSLNRARTLTSNARRDAQTDAITSLPWLSHRYMSHQVLQCSSWSLLPVVKGSRTYNAIW